MLSPSAVTRGELGLTPSWVPRGGDRQHPALGVMLWGQWRQFHFSHLPVVLLGHTLSSGWVPQPCPPRQAVVVVVTVVPSPPASQGEVGTWAVRTSTPILLTACSCAMLRAALGHDARCAPSCALGSTGVCKITLRTRRCAEGGAKSRYGVVWDRAGAAWDRGWLGQGSRCGYCAAKWGWGGLRGGSRLYFHVWATAAAEP